MTKNKRNAGLENLMNLDIKNLSSGASLKENLKEEVKISNQVEPETKTEADNSITVVALRLPTKFHKVIIKNKEDYTITGSINSYIIEAVRKRLIEEGLM
jgi:hypothetical protein